MSSSGNFSSASSSDATTVKSSGLDFINTGNPNNLFEVNAPKRAQQWVLPSEANLTALPKGGPGFGCFNSPNVSIGYPLFSNATVDCAPGFYCPYYELGNVNTLPVACPPDPYCQFLRILGANCLPQGRYEPMPCLTGNYCPNPRTIIPCPAGYYCLRGTVEPIKCQLLSSCPKGTTVQLHYGLLIILKRAKQPFSAIFPAGLLALFARFRKTPVEKTTPEIAANAVVSVRDGVDETEISKMQARVGRLVDGVREALGDDLRMNFSFSDLSLRLPSGVTVLHGVSGEIKAGRLTAIMGPSGAGKTTFMNVLMGKVARTGGELRINGVTTEMQKFKKIIGYVPQDDIMLRELTVRENIMYSARVRLPSSWSSAKVAEHVDHIIEALNLQHVANSQIGDEFSRGISGGQRKRVNVGMELAAAPLSLFLDEPTTGLDSTSALDLSSILSSASHLGLTIVSVIHQPRAEVFSLFDDVLLIAPGGRTAYFGPVIHIRSYFTALGFSFPDGANVADVLMDILSGRGVSETNGDVKSAEEIVDAWSQFVESGGITASGGFNITSLRAEKDDFSVVPKVTLTSTGSSSEGDSSTGSLGVEKMATISRARGAGALSQIWYAHNRSLLQQSRFVGAFFLEAFVGFFAGFIMGAASRLSEPFAGVLKSPYVLTSSSHLHWFVGLYGMLVGIAIALAAGPAGVNVFGEEKPIYWREAASGHNRFSYYLGKNLSVISRIIISSIHFTAIFLFLAKPAIPVELQFLLVLLNFFCVYGVASIISMLVRREKSALVAVIVGLFMAVFCGFGLDLETAAEGGYLWIFSLGANRWAAEAQYWLWIKNYSNIYDLRPALSYGGYEANKVTRNLCAMLGLGIAYRVVAFVLMIVLNRQKQK
ncbi:hypothetical protein BC829DRAFT_490653 [Chytridium lagenaria]|nr:hypothetical protein BC829DRAFT_490653 [Chytridium lagenaria]